MGELEFSVYWWDRDGGQHRELQFVDVQRAVRAAHRLCQGPASALGFVTKVMITDGGDHCNFLWEKGELIYPTKKMLDENRTREKGNDTSRMGNT